MIRSITRGPLLVFWYLFFAPVSAYATWVREDIEGGRFWFLFGLAMIVSIVQILCITGMSIFYIRGVLPPWTDTVFISSGLILGGLFILLVLTVMFFRRNRYEWGVGILLIISGIGGMIYVTEPVEYVKSLNFRIPVIGGVYASGSIEQYRSIESCSLQEKINLEDYRPFKEKYIALEKGGFRVGVPMKSTIKEHNGGKVITLSGSNQDGTKISFTERLYYQLWTHFTGSLYSEIEKKDAKVIFEDFRKMTDYELTKRILKTSYEDVRKADDFASLARAEALLGMKYSSYLLSPVRRFRTGECKGFIMAREGGGSIWFYSHKGDFLFDMLWGGSKHDYTSKELPKLFKRMLVSVKRAETKGLESDKK